MEIDELIKRTIEDIRTLTRLVQKSDGVERRLRDLAFNLETEAMNLRYAVEGMSGSCRELP